MGHYAKKEAQEAVDREYSACHAQASLLMKKHRIKKRSFEPQEAFNLCWNICDVLGHKKLKKLVLRSPDVSNFAGAHYTKGEIHFPYNYIHTTTLLHELAHHLCYYGRHGKEFMEMQELVYEAAMNCDKALLTKE